MIEFIKKHYQLLLIGILVISLSVSIFTRPEPTSNTVKEYKLQAHIDSLNNVSKLRNLEYIKKDEKIVLLTDSINKISLKIDKNNKEIYKLRKKYQDAHDSIAKFTTTNINTYFDKRYGR